MFILTNLLPRWGRNDDGGGCSNDNSSSAPTTFYLVRRLYRLIFKVGCCVLVHLHVTCLFWYNWKLFRFHLSVIGFLPSGGSSTIGFCIDTLFVSLNTCCQFDSTFIFSNLIQLSFFPTVRAKTFDTLNQRNARILLLTFTVLIITLHLNLSSPN